MPEQKNDLTDFCAMLDRQAEKREREIAEWNLKYPPHKETVAEDGVMIGMWHQPNGSIAWAPKTSRGYMPYELVLVPVEVCTEIRTRAA